MFNFNRKADIKTLEISDEPLANHYRGWYEIFSFAIDDEVDFEELKWCLKANEQLVLVVIDISNYRLSEISSAAIKNYRQIIKFFSNNDKDIILRITYDRVGNAIMTEPDSQAIIYKHIEQLMAVNIELKNSIYIIQGIFVGNWGEMHGSKYLDESSICAAAKYMSDCLEDKSTHIVLRKPVYIRYCMKESDNPLNNIDDTRRLFGFFDDGMFGSATHLGTFMESDENDLEWKKTWSIEKELEFINNIAQAVPVGGEVLSCQSKIDIDENYPCLLTPIKTVEQLRKMQVTYLNCVHDKMLLDKWKEQTYEGRSLYEYVTLNMGYRLVAQSVKIKCKKTYNIVSVTIKNIGFAPCYNKFEAKLLILNKDIKNDYKADVKFADSKCVLKPFKAALNIDFTYKLPKIKGYVYIKLVFKENEKQLFLSNKSSDDEETIKNYGIRIGEIL